MRKQYYNGYTIIIKNIVRDWSETAVEYSVVDTNIKGECEDHKAREIAETEINKLK